MRGRAERSYSVYCPPKTRQGVTNTGAVYSGAGTRTASMSEEAILLRIGRNKILRIQILKIVKNKNGSPKARVFCLVMSENAKNKVFGAVGALRMRFQVGSAEPRPRLSRGSAEAGPRLGQGPVKYVNVSFCFIRIF